MPALVKVTVQEISCPCCCSFYLVFDLLLACVFVGPGGSLGLTGTRLAEIALGEQVLGIDVVHLILVAGDDLDLIGILSLLLVFL